MSRWFNEQINVRQRMDERDFEESLLRMSDSIMGVRLSAAREDARQSAKNALEELLGYFGISSYEDYGPGKELFEVLEYLLEPHGIMYRGVNLEEGWHKDAGGVMLARLEEDGRLITLIPGAFGGYYYRDPVTGKRIKVSGSNAKRIGRDGVCFYRPFPMGKMEAKDLFYFMWQDIPLQDMLLYLLFAMAVVLTGLVVPRISQEVIAGVVPANSHKGLLAALVFMVSASLAALCFGLLRTTFYDRIAVRLGFHVQAAGMMRLLSLPAGVFREFNAGDLFMRLSYLEKLVTLLLSIGLSTGLTAILSLVYTVQIAYFAPSLLLPVLCIAGVQLLVVMGALAVEIPVSREWMCLEAKESGLAFELIAGVKKLRTAGAEKRGFSRWGRVFAQKLAYRYDPPALLKVSDVLVSAAALAGGIIIYHIVLLKGVSVASFYGFYAAFAMFEASLAAFAMTGHDMGQIRPIMEMVRPILNAEPEVAKRKQPVERLRGAIELSKVSFSYREDMPEVLSEVSLKIDPGQYVALVGLTGSGKSTLLRLLLGFEMPRRGAIYYDNRDMRKLDLRSLRRRIGTVLQDGRLITGSIFDNIRMNVPSLTMEEAWEAARIAGIAGDIEKMPMKMFTMLQEGGGGISGGQRQRILIARAVAGKPEVLFFDEATSALDNINQKRVADSLAELNATRLVIAHRLSTIKSCDRIIVLDGGKIVEDGTYDGLINEKGLFYELVKRQQLEDPFVESTTVF